MRRLLASNFDAPHLLVVYIYIYCFFLSDSRFSNMLLVLPRLFMRSVRFSILSHAFRKSNFLFLFFLPHFFDSPVLYFLLTKLAKLIYPFLCPFLFICLRPGTPVFLFLQSKGDSGPSLPHPTLPYPFYFFSSQPPNTKSQSLSRTASFCRPLPPFFLTYCSLLSPDCSLFLSFIDHDV